jgi:hypothetical protein
MSTILMNIVYQQSDMDLLLLICNYIFNWKVDSQHNFNHQLKLFYEKFLHKKDIIRSFSNIRLINSVIMAFPCHLITLYYKLYT